MSGSAPNFPAQMAAVFVDSKLTPLLILGLLLFGLIGLGFTPREENPQIIVPAAELSVEMPGAFPEEVEHRLLKPLETQLLAISGVKNVYGMALDGRALIQVEFEVGQDAERALVRLYDRVFRFVLPPGANPIRVRAIDVDDVPVFTLTLSSGQYDDYELRRMADRVAEQLRSVADVGEITVVGGQTREFRLETDPERLYTYGISLNLLADAVRGADLSIPVENRVGPDGRNTALRIESGLYTRESLESTIVAARDGRLVRVSDLADVVDGPPPERQRMTRFAYGPASSGASTGSPREVAAVTIAVAKRQGVNAVSLTKSLRDRVSAMADDFLPPGVDLVITRDDGVKADRTVTTLVEHLFIAIGAVMLVLWWSLGYRAALMVALTIPLVFAFVLGMDLLAGPSLNRITLYALILALGMLVDDAIVVTENISRHYAKLPPDASRKLRAAAAIEATREVGNPTTLATFTVVAVFLSLILVTGMLGQYFYPVTFNVPMSMLASLVIAYSVTPWLARRFLPGTAAHEPATESGLQRLYRRLFSVLLRSRSLRWLLVLVTLGLLLASALQPAWQFVRTEGVSGAVSPWGVPLAFLPKDNKETFLVHIHLPETTPLVVTDRAARDVGRLLSQHREVMNYQTHVGYPAVLDFNGQLKGSGSNVGPQFAEIRVNISPKEKRSVSSIEIVHALRDDIEIIEAAYPGGIIQLIEDPPGPPVRATVLAEVYGADYQQLSTLSLEVAREFRQTHDMAEVWASVPFDVPELQIRILHDKVALAGLTSREVSLALKRFMAGEVLGQAHPPGERHAVPIRLHVPRHQRVEPSMLARAFVVNADGKAVPLSELTEVIEGTLNTPIQHKNGERVHYVGGELAASAPVYAVLGLDDRLDGFAISQDQSLRTTNLRFNEVRPDTLDGFQLLWGGELRLTLDAFRDMGLALLLALLSVFLLLVAYYRSFRMPVLAMVPVPLALIGVFPGHWVLGQSFTAASMIGVIALAGVVVRNSLLLIDFAKDYQTAGYSLDDAVEQAGATRLRPIMLTTLAIVLGTLIMVPDPVFGGLAIALIFGAVSAALFSVVVVPLLYRHWALGATQSVYTKA